MLGEYRDGNLGLCCSLGAGQVDEKQFPELGITTEYRQLKNGYRNTELFRDLEKRMTSRGAFVDGCRFLRAPRVALFEDLHQLQRRI